LPRAAKGTARRAASDALYEKEIDELYTRPTPTSTASKNHTLRFRFAEKAQAELRTYLSAHLRIPERDISTTEDLFAFGMDSLQVINLVRAINTARGGDQAPINQEFVYDNPSNEKLFAALYSGARVKEYNEFDDDDEGEKATLSFMEDIYQKEIAHLIEKDGITAPRLYSLKSPFGRPTSSLNYPPNGGVTAWLQVLGSFLINMNNWGLVNTFGICQAFYQSTLPAPYSTSDISWIGTLQGALLLLVGVVSGPLFDQGYFQLMLILGGFGVVFGLIMLSLVTEYYQFLLIQALLIVTCLRLLTSLVLH
jgi:hypothetical protein